MKVAIERYIAELLQRIKDQNERAEATLTANSVTLKRRYRDMTLSDALDSFKDGYWTNIPKRNFYSLNIIKPTVRANTAALVSASTKIDIEPRFTKDSHAQMAADVAKAIRDLKLDEQWTEDLVELIANEVQLAPGCFLRVRHDANAYNPLKASVVEWGQAELKIEKYLCPACGFESGSAQCENCGADAEPVEEEAMSIDEVSEVKEINPGNTVTDFIPWAEMRIDDLGTQGGRLKKARWLEHHYLAPSWKMDAPNNSELSYPIKWQLALQTGRDYDGVAFSDRTVDDWCEVRDLYLTPEMFAHLDLSAPFKLGEFEAEETLLEATYQGQPVDPNNVICFRTVDSKIVEVFPCEFRSFDQEFMYVSFLANPAAFWGLFLTELLPMQDIVNYMLTLQVFHTRRNARTTLVYNSEAFDGEDLEKDIAPTREGFFSDMPINQQFGIIPAVPLSAEPMQLISTVMSLKGDIGGVQPAMVGADASQQGYTTFSGQLLAKNQSLAQLGAVSSALARAKERWVRKQLKEAQAKWAEEEFMFLLKLNPDWTEEYIKAFVEANLETDLVVQYAPGSEVPRSLVEREMSLRQFSQDLMMLAQLDPSLANSKLITDILMQLRQITDVNVDVQDAEEQLHLTSRRIERIKQMIDGLQAEVTDEALLHQVVQQMMGSNPDLHPFERENHDEAIRHLQEQLMNEAQAEMPNQLYIACLKMMIEAHEGAQIAFAQKQLAMQMAAQQPMMDMQQQQQEEAMEQAMMAQAMEEEAKAEDEDRVDRRREEDREAALEDRLMEREFQVEDEDIAREEQIEDANMQRGYQLEDVDAQREKEIEDMILQQMFMSDETGE